MKAIAITKFGGPEVMKLIDMKKPVPASKQVLIKVNLTSVNFADIKARYGQKGAEKLPFIPGLDAAGIIEEIGADVTCFKAGQRVIAFPSYGSYSEYVIANEDLTYAIPDDLSFDIAAACPIVAFLSYKLLADIARIEQGETVLIHSAAGGVGTTAIQMAKILGAGQVIGTVGSDVKMPVAYEAGADHVISYEHESFVDKVNELTNGEGVNIILDSIAGDVTERSLQCLARYGRLVHFGNSSGETGHFNTHDVHSSCRSILGFSLGTTRKIKPQLLKAAADHVFQYLKEGRLTIKIGGKFKLEDAAKAHEWMESRQSIGKILLEVR